MFLFLSYLLWLVGQAPLHGHGERRWGRRRLSELVPDKGFDVIEGVLAELEVGRRLAGDEFPVRIADDETGATQLAVSHRHVAPGGNVPVHDAGFGAAVVAAVVDPETVRVVKIEGDVLRFDADAEKLHAREGGIRRPLSHLCRAGAAPASPAVVKVHDRRFPGPRQELGARRQLIVDGVPVGAADEVDVEIPHGIAVFEAHGGWEEVISVAVVVAARAARVVLPVVDVAATNEDREQQQRAEERATG